MGGRPVIRDMEDGDLDGLAALWFDGWQDAHAAILPERLRRARTAESFRARLADHRSAVRVVTQDDAIAGFCIVRADELDQFYVASRFRGAGIAGALMDDARTTFRRAGVETAWLACAIGNDRAARFYEKCGWHNAGVMVHRLPIDGGIVPLDVWRYEIALGTGET
jgi:ribosomal protein S18 acetylase RimI-like enzyme